jgi:hypothetical protein
VIITHYRNIELKDNGFFSVQNFISNLRVRNDVEVWFGFVTILLLLLLLLLLHRAALSAALLQYVPQIMSLIQYAVSIPSPHDKCSRPFSIQTCPSAPFCTINHIWTYRESKRLLRVDRPTTNRHGSLCGFQTLAYMRIYLYIYIICACVRA